METKRYLITDPCYLYPEYEKWNALMDDTILDDKRWTEVFNRNVQDDLIKRYGVEAVVASTGFGDWTNDMKTVDKTAVVEQSFFYADAGMVVIMEATPEIESEFSDVTMAIVEVTSDQPIHAEIQEDPDWSMVRIFAGNTLVAKSSEYTSPWDDDGWD